jgi:hypothetical protein
MNMSLEGLPKKFITVRKWQLQIPQSVKHVLRTF